MKQPYNSKRKSFRRYFERLETRRLLTSDVIGDFDESGVYSVPDINALCAEVSSGAHNARFDLTGDQLVDQSDLADFLERAGSLPGDANLDGIVDFSDFLSLSTGFGKEGSWSNGNFACNEPAGRVGFGDFLTLSTNFGKVGIVQLAEVETVSPGDGEEMVNVTREVVVRFDSEVIPSTVNNESIYLLAGGEKLNSRIVVSGTERFATVFHDAALPPSANIRMVIDGDQIVDRSGRLLDADSDGNPGGSLVTEFQTLPLTRITSTNVFGFVRDSMTGEPIVGATIRVDAFPEANVTTDSQGRFELKDVPAPDFFVHIDGSTASGLDEGLTYPNVGKPFHSVPGQTVQLKADGNAFDIYLPQMALDDIQTLSPEETTVVGLGDRGKSDLAELFPETPPEVWENLTLSVEPGAAVDDLGNPSTQAAVIPVPSNRIPAPLPSFMAGMSSLVISIQAGTATNFDIPAALTMPNLDDLPPAARVPIMSFDHDAGAWKHTATGIVSDDGQVIETEPGTGISAPGWHFIPPGGKKGDQKKDRKCGFKCILKKVVKDGRSEIKPRQRAYVSGKRGAAMPHQFDFGTESSPLAEDYERVTQFSAFNEEQGFGWIAGELIATDSGLSDTSNELTQDFVETDDGHFAVTLANGIYEVSVTIGDASPRRVQTGIYLEGSLAANVAADGAEFVTATQTIVVEDGRLDVDVVRLSGSRATINALTISFESDLGGSLIEAEGTKYFALQEVGSEFVVRGTFGAQNEFLEEMLFAENTDYQLFVFSPGSLAYGVAQFSTTGLSQPDDRIPFPTLAISEGPDQDDDGLIDTIEFTLGTALNRADTDDDGISDLAEVEQGLNPLDDLVFPTGIVGRLDAAVGALAIDVAGNRSGGMTAYMGTSRGLALADVSQFDRPTSLGEVILPGGVVDVAVDPLRDIAVVARNNSHSLIDVSDPMLPTVISTNKRDAKDVELLDGHAYLAGGQTLTSIDLATSEILLDLDLGKPISTMTRAGNHLYVLHPTELQIVEIFGPTMVRKGVVDLGTLVNDIAVGDEVAYIAVGGLGGYMTVDVSNPNEPLVISQAQSKSLEPGIALALNGSGLAVLAGLNLAAKVFDVSDTSQTDRVLAPFEVPTVIRDVAIAGGIAFLAPSRGSGLMVLNYAPFDVNGQAPTVSVDATGLDLDPSAPGIQIESGSRHTIQPVVNDDVQIYSVELLLNGEPVSRDISFPFELPFETPLDAVGESIGVQVRATDTGGNITVSPITPFDVVADDLPPELLAISPGDGEIQVVGLKSVALTFSEPIDASRLRLDSISLTGPDGATITPLVGSVQTGSRILRFAFEPLNTAGNYEVAIDAASISDLAGNPLSSDPIAGNFELLEGTIFWTAPQDGFWDDPSNWDLGRVPNENDIVSIKSSEDVTVTIRQHTVVGAIRATEHLLLTNNLDLSQYSILAGGITIDNGSLNPIDDLELAGESHFIRGTINAAGELENNGTLVLSGAGTKLLNGNLNNSDTILYSGENWGLDNLSESVIVNEPDAVFKIETVGSISSFRNSGDTRIENYGVIEVDSEGPAFILAKVSNLGGTITVSNGGLTIHSPSSNSVGGTLNVSEDATLTYNGSFSGEFSGEAVGQIALNNMSVAEGNAAIFRFEGSGVEFTGTATIDGILENGGFARWLGGTFEAAGTLRNTGTLEVSSSSTKTLTGSFSNLGTVHYLGNNWRLDAPSVIRNEPDAVFNITEADLGALRRSLDERFENYGTVQVNNQTATLVAPKFDNFGGTISVISGGLNINSPANSSMGGTLNVSENATLTYSGSFSGELSGEAAGKIELHNVNVEEGNTAVFSFEGAGVEFTGSATIDGVLENRGFARWLRGSIEAAGDFRNMGTLEVVTGNTKTLNGNLTNLGALDYAGDNWNLDASSVIRNEPDAVFNIAEGNLGSLRFSEDERFENYGSFIVGSAGQNSVAVPFSNEGGTISVVAGGALRAQRGFSMTGGSIQLNVNGPASTEYGRILVTGQASLAGTLLLVLADPVPVGTSDELSLLTFTSLVGEFEQVDIAPLSGTLQYDDTRIRLDVG